MNLASWRGKEIERLSKSGLEKLAVNCKLGDGYLTFRLRLDFFLDLFSQLGVRGLAFAGWHLGTLSSCRFLDGFLFGALVLGSLRLGS